MFDKYLTPKSQGLVIMAIGIVLLLNAIGFIDRGLNSLIIIASIGLVIYGFIQADGPHFVKKLLKKKDNIVKK